MNAAGWQELKDLFIQAREQPVARRLDFLKERCGDTVLVNEVLSLLEAERDSEAVIETHAIDLAQKLSGETEDYSNRHFGKYRIIREIGSGGMGTVFLAERDDGEFVMQVALKIVRQSIADRAIIDRFRRERQILAGLRHPHIAALYDGGVSDKGEPYLAMEYVEGDDLIAHCSKRGLDVAAKLRLFMKVCSAVAYAHGQHVAHRDLKPSNIMVTSDSAPKLLDFGLAKAFETDAQNTQTAQRAFTPAYASPEQVRGDNITTASDIYSLGVLLYELLTGKKPLNFENKSFEEIVQTIGHAEPPRPSSVRPDNQPDGRSRTLRGDLDNITLTCLRKEPERRYASAESLADDIERHLAGLPVSARPNTKAYRAGKFIKRNKIVVAATMVVLLSLLAGLIASLWEADQSRRERDRAEKRFQDVRQLSNSLLFEISPLIEKLPGSIEAREMLVKRAVEYLDSLTVESQNDPALRAELASAYEKVGDLQGNVNKPNLGDLTGAVVSLDKAVAIRRALPATLENQVALARGLEMEGVIRDRQFDVKNALDNTDEAVEILSNVSTAYPDVLDVRTAEIEARLEHGQIFSANNQYSEAIPIFQETLRRLGDLPGDQLRVRCLTAKGMALYANALSWNDQQAEAEAETEKALAISNTLGDEFAGDATVQSAVWPVYSYASSVFEDSRPELSLQLAERSRLIAERTIALDRADVQARHDLARSFSRIGLMSAKLKHFTTALDDLSKAEATLNDLTEREPKNVLYRRDLAKLLVRYGDVYEEMKDIPAALRSYQRSADIFEAIAAADAMNTLAQRDLAQSLKSVGQMQVILRQTADARSALNRSRDILVALRERGALGDYDLKLIADVEHSLRSIGDG